MKPRVRWAFVPLVLLIAALMACSDDSIAISKIFVAPPWTGTEEYSYRVTDKGVDGEGRCRLVTTPESAPGQTKIERLCEKDEFRDDGTVIVDSRTLEPIESTRVNADTKKGKTSTFSVTYSGTVATFVADIDGKKRSTDRDLPEPDAESPDPGWYDDESLLWLARGLPLQGGFHGGYAHVINAGQPRILDVEVDVSGPETVTVPAGEFQAWRVRFRRESSIYDVWVETAAPHRVVKARIEDVTYELLPTN